jgi:chitinase
MRNAFQGRYGISVTLPASYWYLRWFDLQSMQENIDFFNVMTNDIHGVWDASHSITGPYVRPHTNITEIKLSLDLLWRNNVDPSRVNFGLGWYGRSFTLEDPACNQPNCIFSYGGKPGECTNSSGTLSNSEIRRIITENNLTPSLDVEAAVKWISWDIDQWVSYDDGETIQMKIAEANRLCLGGVSIWAVDLDDLDHTSSNDVLGIGPANGVSPADAESFREQKESIERAATIANSCYWTFCGEQCAERYTSHAYARGQVPNIEGDVSCRDRDDIVRTSVRTLCCAPGTTTGTCSWYGWNGVGMACSTGYCPSGKELIAMNSEFEIVLLSLHAYFDVLTESPANSYIADPDLSINNNLTCTGTWRFLRPDGVVMTKTQVEHSRTAALDSCHPKSPTPTVYRC